MKPKTRYPCLIALLVLLACVTLFIWRGVPYLEHWGDLSLARTTANNTESVLMAYRARYGSWARTLEEVKQRIKDPEVKKEITPPAGVTLDIQLKDSTEKTASYQVTLRSGSQIWQRNYDFDYDPRRRDYWLENDRYFK